jgi:hypothetical protein
MIKIGKRMIFKGPVPIGSREIYIRTTGAHHKAGGQKTLVVRYDNRWYEVRQTGNKTMLQTPEKKYRPRRGK